MLFLNALTAALTVQEPTSHRKLSTQAIGNYQPTTVVTDHANIDLDQKSMEAEFLSAFPMANSQSIYDSGCHSKPTGTCTLSKALITGVAKKGAITYTNNAGQTVTAKAYDSYSAGATTIKMMYPVGEVNPQSVACYVNGLTTTQTNGCMDVATEIVIGSDAYNCTSVTNAGGRTLKGFSTAAKKKMYDATMSSSDCPAYDSSKGYRYGCPYTSFEPYWNYYCKSTTSSCFASGDYANQIVTSAFDGSATGLDNNNADFSTGAGTSVDIRKQVIKKGTAYMNAWMYAVREFEDAIDDCQVGSSYGNDPNSASSGPVHAWDEGVGFYVGSLIEITMLYGDNLATISSQGKLAYTLGNKRCANYKTCGPNGGETSGQAHINYELWKQFRLGQIELLAGNCAGVVAPKNEIVKLMTVPLVQGTLRYAYKCDKSASCSEAAAGELYIFAASVIPQLHACDAAKATAIESMLAPSAFTCTGGTCTSTVVDYSLIKSSFESCYEQMGITCTQVGGLWDKTLEKYMDTNGDASPCMDNYPPPSAPPPSPGNPAPLPVEKETEKIPTWAIAVIIIVAILFLVVCVGFCYLIQMEKAGKPIFVTTPKGAA